MNSSVSQYLTSLQAELKTGHAQEHSYRPALKTLFESIAKMQVVNEPKGSAHGRPDFIFLKGETPIAWVEAKDVHVSPEKIEKSEQMARYFGYANLILTNGLEFRFYKNGKAYGEPIVIAVKKGEMITSEEKNFDLFARTLTDFLAEPIDTIRSAEHLAKIMGGKARRLRDNIIEMLSGDFKGSKVEIENIMRILKDKLIRDLTVEQFADIYAQTLVYGLFVARYHDETPETFSRSEALEKIPASNHLLQQFFGHIALTNFEKRLAFIVDELCDVFVHSDVHALVHGLYQQKEEATHDPIIHFYEDFLREYDPKLRMERGVFYTPLPVVRYIVRSVDALLKQHFGLNAGIAETAQTEWTFEEHGKKVKQQIDRVQILDPAVGTGTFLNEVIRQIHTTFKGQEGSWQSYADQHLIPRLHGFELMMASYTIAHLKLNMTLAETGITKLQKRLRIYLTNSLEEAPQKDDTLFGRIGLDGALTEEALAAEEVKRDLPIMVVMGNPPYSVSSQNKSIDIGIDGKKRKTWIGNLLDDYKKDLNEKKLNLDDDYIKFIRFSHYLIEKNGQGIVAMITNNSYFDGITHRRMRESLLQTFDHIYILDLHGSSNLREKSLDGSKDQNVFDIQQGVGITILVKNSSGKKKALGTVHHMDMYGAREIKYGWLNEHDAITTKWNELLATKPNYFFVPKDFDRINEYEFGLKLDNVFVKFSSGIQTKRDSLCIQWSEKDLENVKNDFISLNSADIKTKYILSDDNRDWRIEWAQKDIQDNNPKDISILYRPFDYRWTMYTGKSKGFIGYPRADLMNNLLQTNNLSLITTKMIKNENFAHALVTDRITEMILLSNKTSNTAFQFLLYIYPNASTIDDEKRRANLNMELLNPVLKKLKLKWIEDGAGDGNTNCGPEDIFDYIYALLHSPTYRSRYKEFLKIDFPRVPFTSNKNLFWKLVKLGREVRGLHLMESEMLNHPITTYPKDGTNVVEKVSYDDEHKRVLINATQYFEGVDEDVWNFPIGGYQPLQKWLKDRKGRTLTFDDISHYQKIVVALKETGRLMKEIDAVIAENGGFPIQ